MMKSFFGNGTRYQETPKLSAEKTDFLVTTILMQFTWKLEVFVSSLAHAAKHQYANKNKKWCDQTSLPFHFTSLCHIIVAIFSHIWSNSGVWGWKKKEVTANNWSTESFLSVRRVTKQLRNELQTTKQQCHCRSGISHSAQSRCARPSAFRANVCLCEDPYDTDSHHTWSWTAYIS